MNAHAKLAVSLIVLSGLFATAGLSRSAAATRPEEAEASAQSTAPEAARFRIGPLEAIALRDGGMTGVPNDNQILGVGKTPAEVAAVLTANGLPGDSFALSIQPLLVRDGDRSVLIDAGAGSAMGEGAGKLTASLAVAGIAPSAITDVLISHGHGDHVAGLVDASGTPTFPNAVVRMSAPEWVALQADAQMTALVAAIRPKVETFQPGAQVTPSIKAVPIEGHTPGHTGYEIGSGPDRLLYIADAAHHSVISVQRPDWANAFDGNDQAMQSRIALLNRAAAENLRLYAVHFPYPGIGRVQKRDDVLVWVPEVQPGS